MTPSHSPALGLSIGSTTLAAVSADRVVVGRPALTRCGWVLDDFAHRVGDPVGVVAPDGSVHTGAALMAQALHELARRATAGRPVPAAVTVAHPAHWRPAAVDALGRALRRMPAWSEGVRLVPDCAAALAVLRQNPGLPSRGVIAVCDFGARASTVTLVDAGNGLQSIGEPLRSPDFSGDIIDRALMAHVLATAGATPGATATSSIGALTRLRTECRAAKERLSAQTVTTVPGAPAGVRGDIRITRPELDRIIGESLPCVLDVVQDALRLNGIAPNHLVAVASVGGMAAAPAVTTALSERLRVPVLTAPEPALAAARGAALHATRATTDDHATVITPARRQPAPDVPALAWSSAPEAPEFVPQLSTRRCDPRPRLDFVPEPEPAAPRIPWHSRPLVLAAAVLAVVAGAGGATALALRADTTASRPAPAEPVPAVPRTLVAVPGPSAELHHR